MNETSRIRINLSAAEHNVRLVRRIVGPQCALCPIVKADAYGLGAALVARHLVAAGANMLAVYTPQQAAELAKAAVGGPVLVLMPVREMQRADEAYRLLIQGRLHLTVHDGSHLEDLLRIAERFATIIPVHLEVDTGMSRGGCPPEEAPAVAQRISGNRWLRLAGVSTHFARSGDDARFTNRQAEEFDAVVEACGPAIPPDCVIHVANTFAILRSARFHRRMVRFGQAWVGFGAESMSAGDFRREGLELRPIVSWRSQIVAVRTVRKGTTVGYGSRWTARRKSRIGLVSAGYADGYPVGAASTDDSPKPPCVGVITGKRAYGQRFARVVGQVNMDQITIDLTDIAPPGGDDSIVAPGTAVELIGTDPKAPNHVPNLARIAETIPHQILCSLNPRIRRTYHATEAYSEPEKKNQPGVISARAGVA